MAIALRLLALLGLVMNLGCAEELLVGQPVTHLGNKVDIAEYPNVQNSIFGGWIGPNISNDSSVSMIPQVYINNKGKSSFSMACSRSNSLVMFATVDIPLDFNRVDLNNSVENVFSDNNGNSCSVRVEAGITSFFLHNGDLRVNHPLKGDVIFKRIQY